MTEEKRHDGNTQDGDSCSAKSANEDGDVCTEVAAGLLAKLPSSAITGDKHGAVAVI